MLSLSSDPIVNIPKICAVPDTNQRRHMKGLVKERIARARNPRPADSVARGIVPRSRTAVRHKLTHTITLKISGQLTHKHPRGLGTNAAHTSNQLVALGQVRVGPEQIKPNSLKPLDFGVEKSQEVFVGLDSLRSSHRNFQALLDIGSVFSQAEDLPGNIAKLQMHLRARLRGLGAEKERQIGQQIGIGFVGFVQSPQSFGQITNLSRIQLCPVDVGVAQRHAEPSRVVAGGLKHDQIDPVLLGKLDNLLAPVVRVRNPLSRVLTFLSNAELQVLGIDIDSAGDAFV